MNADKLAAWNLAFGAPVVRLTAGAKVRAEIVASGNARKLAAYDAACARWSEHLHAEIAESEDDDSAE